MRNKIIIIFICALFSCKKENTTCMDGNYGWLNSYSFIEENIILKGNMQNVIIKPGLLIQKLKAGTYIGGTDTLIINSCDTTYRGFVNDGTFGLGNLNINTDSLP